MAGGSSNRGGDGQQQQQQQGQGISRGGDLHLQGQGGGRVDFAPVRDLEVNTSASRAQADKSTLKVCTIVLDYQDNSEQVLTILRCTCPTEASTLSSLAMPPISR